MPSDALVDPVSLRARFSEALSVKYRREVPLYGTLLDLVAETNRAAGGAGDHRLGSERHGAIRVGTASELALVARLFGLIGMQAVGCSDLAAAGVPVHSTAFRPIALDSLEPRATREPADRPCARLPCGDHRWRPALPD